MYFKLIPLKIDHLEIIDQWVKIAETIGMHYKTATGFVVISSLEYLASLASGVSFTFENLAKPVIFTSGFRRISYCNNDSSPNFYGALTLAGNYQIPEVGIYCNGQLYRANRTMRLSCNNTSLFVSPNYPPLATIDDEIAIHWENVLNPPYPGDKFQLSKNFSKRVSTLLVVPDLNDDMVEEAYGLKNKESKKTGEGDHHSIDSNHGRYGVILETFGNGRLELIRQHNHGIETQRLDKQG